MEQQTRVERRDRSRALLQLAEAERRAKGEPLPSVPVPSLPTRKALRLSVSSRNILSKSSMFQLPVRSPCSFFDPLPLPFLFCSSSSSVPLPLPFLFLFRSSSPSVPLPTLLVVSCA